MHFLLHTVFKEYSSDTPLQSAVTPLTSTLYIHFVFFVSHFSTNSKVIT